MLLFKGTIVARDPFMIGNGDDNNSDRDILRDASGNPFIPGTTLAGVCRHFLVSQGMPGVDDLFGFVQGDLDASSKIAFYDSFTESASWTVRDSVKVENKLSVKGGKFDYELAEAGVRFGVRILMDGDDLDVLKKIAKGLDTEEILIGAKTNRGFGSFEFENSPLYVHLDLSTKEGMGKYINLDEKWSIVTEPLKYEDVELTAGFHREEVELSLRNFLFIRDYATTIKVDNDINSKCVDAQTLTDPSGNPIIPGTAWSGVFRHHMERILKICQYPETSTKTFLNELFGMSDEQSNEHQKANIRFEKSTLSEHVVFINRTRTAIDRVSGSALQTGALFTGRIACVQDGAECPVNLCIKIKTEYWNRPITQSLLTICIDDLKNGFLTVGGNSSIGAGCFQ